MGPATNEPEWRSGGLRCTSCQQPLQRPVEVCPACGADLRGEWAVTYRPRPGRLGRGVAWAALIILALCILATAIMTIWKIILEREPS